MTFEQSLAWLTTFVAGFLASWLQEKLKGTPIGEVSQRTVALVLALVFAGAAWGVQIALGIPLFEDVRTGADILMLLVAWLTAWGGSQAFYANVYR